jgi:hypothetical protein
MASKEKKTAPEIVAMITDEIRRYPQYNCIIDITVVPSQGGQTNWSANYNTEATRSGPWPVYLTMEIDKLIRLFQNDFELI